MDTVVKKKRKWIKVLVGILLALVVLFVILYFVLVQVRKSSIYKEENKFKVEQTSGYVIDTYINAVNSFNITTLSDKSVILNSYVAKEVEFINNNELVEEFIKMSCSAVSVDNLDYLNMLTDDSVEVSIWLSSIDYVSLSDRVEEDKDIIKKLMLDAGLSRDSLDYDLRIQNIFLLYMKSLSNIPLISTSMTLTLEKSDTVSGNEFGGVVYVVQDDKLVDDLLFGSSMFHSMLDSFGMIATEWTGLRVENYMDTEEQETEAHIEWVSLLDAEIAKYPVWVNNRKCLYEPFYVRDADGNIVKDDSGNKVIDYYILYLAGSNGKKISDSSSKYKYKQIEEPPKTELVSVKKEREIEDKWIMGESIPYSWIGYNYHEQMGSVIRVGDGTPTYPLGLNTYTISESVSYVEGYDPVPIRIEMVSYYMGEDAVQYAISASEKNRGLDGNSVVKLVICEFRLTNLSINTVTICSDMVLVDSSGNKSSRTGTLYGLTEEITLKAGESATLEDWATSTDMDNKQVAWGKNFEVSTPLVYFDVIQSE